MADRKRLWLLGALLAVAGCVDGGAEDTASDRDEIAGVCGAWGGTYSGVTFTDEQATHAIDMADHATADELRALAGVGPSIASRIIDARPFATQPDPLAALDGVAYVGENVLTSFRDRAFASWCVLDDGRQSCCFQVPCDAGTASGVVFTAEQTHNVLEWANYATRDELTAVCGVGPSIAAGIEAARPIDSLAALDAVPYVGPTALHRMLGDAGYECATEGSQGRPVEYDWCMDHECACGAPEPVVEDFVCEGDLECVSTLDPDLRAVVDYLLATGPKCEDSVYFPVTYGYLTITTVSETPTGYVVNLLQMIDPEGGIQCWMRYTVNADYEVTDGPIIYI